MDGYLDKQLINNRDRDTCKYKYYHKYYTWKLKKEDTISLIHYSYNCISINSILGKYTKQ